MGSDNSKTITIQEIEKSKFKIEPEYAVALDGGTVGFRLDIGSEKFDICLDRRIDTNTRDEFYLGGYPGSEGSVPLGKSEKLLSALEKLIDSTKPITLQEIEKSDFKLGSHPEIARDGGTIVLPLTIGDETYPLYWDGRTDSKTRGEFYLNRYPDNEGSIYLGKSTILSSAFVEIIKKDSKNSE